MLNPSGCFGGTSHSAGHSTPSIPRWGRGLAFALWVLTPSPGRGATSGPSPQVPRRGRGDPTASLHGISDLAPRASGVGIGGGIGGCSGHYPSPNPLQSHGMQSPRCHEHPGWDLHTILRQCPACPLPKITPCPVLAVFPECPKPRTGLLADGTPGGLPSPRDLWQSHPANSLLSYRNERESNQETRLSGGNKTRGERREARPHPHGPAAPH